MNKILLAGDGIQENWKRLTANGAIGLSNDHGRVSIQLAKTAAELMALAPKGKFVLTRRGYRHDDYPADLSYTAPNGAKYFVLLNQAKVDALIKSKPERVEFDQRLLDEFKASKCPKCRGGGEE